MGREDISPDFTRERKALGENERSAVMRESVMRESVMRESVMRKENGVSRLTLHASLLTRCTPAHAARPPSRSESYG